MTIVDLIKRDHDDIAELFVQLAVLAHDDRRRDEPVRAAARLVVAIRTHAFAEERVLYQALEAKTGALKAFALAGPHEHETLDITIDKLLARRPGDEFQVIVRVARDLFEMHARDEEEADVLPRLLVELSADELVTLADDMIAEKARLRPHISRLVGTPRAA